MGARLHQREPEPVFFHDPGGDGAPSTSAWRAPAFATHHDQHLIEERGEDLRLAYVALTRARHQAVIWWAGSWDSRNSPLGRLLFGREEDGNVAADAAADRPRTTWCSPGSSELEQAAPRSISVDALDVVPDVAVSPTGSDRR